MTAASIFFTLVAIVVVGVLLDGFLTMALWWRDNRKPREHGRWGRVHIEADCRAPMQPVRRR